MHFLRKDKQYDKTQPSIFRCRLRCPTLYKMTRRLTMVRYSETSILSSNQQYAIEAHLFMPAITSPSSGVQLKQKRKIQTYPGEIVLTANYQRMQKTSG